MEEVLGLALLNRDLEGERKYMNSTILEHINELFDSYDLFAGKYK